MIMPNSEMKLQQDQGRVIKVSGIIKRPDLRANHKLVFLFGDNVADYGKPFDQRVGRGGQAAEMAGEPNAVGIPTLWKAPNGTDESAYFSDTKIPDEKLSEIKAIIDKAFAQIKPGSRVVVPVDEQGEINLGTGVAQLSTRAPSLLKYIESKIRELEVQAQAPQSLANNAQVPVATVSQPYLPTGKPFSIVIKLPKEAAFTANSKPQVMLVSPILGPLDVTKLGATVSSGDTLDTITVTSNQPIPASIKIGDRDVPTQSKFPIVIISEGKTIAATIIEIGPDKAAAKPETAPQVSRLAGVLQAA